jgi:phosphatidylserine/phosphatidylglycerophosphate/cardiolipin synthase-like enzyme
LRTLAASLRDGALAAGLSRRSIQQITGAGGDAVAESLTTMTADGMQPRQIAMVIEAIASARDHSDDPAKLFDLVMSGPDVYGFPTGDTAAVISTLIQDADGEVLLVGYAIHNGRRLFEPLAARMQSNPKLRVRLCIDIPRRQNDTSLAAEIVRRYVADFRTKHWPWNVLPELFYDPRSLLEAGGVRSSLHAKCIVVDRSSALVTSANFTEAAQQRNIEVGILTRYRPMVERLAGYFDSLCASGGLTAHQWG